MRIIAVDWSGAQLAAAKHIWLAEAASPTELIRLESGRSRDQLAAHLLQQIQREPRSVIGLDFAFAFPTWFSEQLGCRSAHELWAYVAAEGERWLTECPPPFWGRGARPRPSMDGSPFRRTELEVPRHTGIGPKSIFQIGGAGAVGTGSLRGMPLLHTLQAAGASIWPFDPPGWPRVVEIYPRLLTGPVNKSDAAARARHLDARAPRVSGAQRELAVRSEDAFDAAVSALVMAEHATALAELPLVEDAVARREGLIWHPGDSPRY